MAAATQSPSTDSGSRSHLTERGEPHRSSGLPGRRNQPDGGRGDRGGKSRERGRGPRSGRGRGAAASAARPSNDPTTEGSSGRPPGDTRRIEGAPALHNDSPTRAVPRNRADTLASDDADVCFICASLIEHVSIAPCNHQTCHICALRLRALYKTRACAHCRTEAPFVVFTDSPQKRFEDFRDEDFAKIDENLGIKYERDIILEDTILLLRYNCPDKDCDVACLGWPDLHRHVRTKHGKIMCDLCTRNKKVFTHEHELFTFGDLRKHEKFGDDNPGAVDQSGFKGHPECGFCKRRFYGDDELYSHCREEHERCHICDRRDGGRNPQYYRNYQELEKHFAAEHFVCLDAECQANKTNVFESEMDLKAHQLSEHPNGLSKDARRDARLVNLTGFDIRTPYQAPRRGGRENRAIGRAQDSSIEPLPLSSAQPLSRAELAYQRQLAIQSSQSVSQRQFGGQLTQSRPPHDSSARVRQPSPPIAIENLTLDSSPGTGASLTPQDQARAVRHQAVISRATNLLKGDKTKVSQFRNHVSAYRSGTNSATDLIELFFSLFDCSSADLGKLVRELSDIYEDESKRQSLLEAWNNWRSINEDYPSLPGPSGTLPGVSNIGAGSSGRRVLTLKKSTAQSSRSAVSMQGSWGNAIATGSSSEAFPSLSAAVGSTRRPAGGGSMQPAWGNTSMPQASHTTIGKARPAPMPASSQGATTSNRKRPPGQTEEMFPSLPTAPKPNTTMAGFNTRGSVRWLTSSRNSPSASGTASPVNAWGNGGLTPTPAQAAAAVADAVASASNPGDDGGIGGAQDAGGKRKGKKSKKGETLIHFG